MRINTWALSYAGAILYCALETGAVSGISYMVKSISIIGGKFGTSSEKKRLETHIWLHFEFHLLHNTYRKPRGFRLEKEEKETFLLRSSTCPV